MGQGANMAEPTVNINLDNPAEVAREILRYATPWHLRSFMATD
jgi:hypothetical protein